MTTNKMFKAWNKGGTLHNSTGKQWMNASEENKIATCSSMLLTLSKQIPNQCSFSLAVAKKQPDLMTEDEKKKATQELMGLAIQVVACINGALSFKDQELLNLRVYQLAHAAMAQLGLLKIYDKII